MVTPLIFLTTVPDGFNMTSLPNNTSIELLQEELIDLRIRQVILSIQWSLFTVF